MTKKQKRDHGTAENPQPVTYTIPEPEAPQVTEAPKAEVKAAKTAKPVSIEAQGEVKAVKAGTKLALLIDLLYRPEGATIEQLATELSRTGSKVDGSGVRSWLSYDLRRTGLGVKDVDGVLSLVGTPLPHREAGVNKVPATTTLKVERGSAKVRKAAMRPPKKSKAGK